MPLHFYSSIRTSPLTAPPDNVKYHAFENEPTSEEAGDVGWWRRFVRGTINGIYRCAAVAEVVIKQRRHNRRHWEVSLYAGNDPAWLEPHLKGLAETIVECGFEDLESIRVTVPGRDEVRAWVGE